MVLHGFIFILTTALAAGALTGKVPICRENRRGVRLFVMMSLLGNLIGLFLTIRAGKEEAEMSLMLDRQDISFTESGWTVSVDGEDPESVAIRVPRREISEKEEEEKVPYVSPEDLKKQEIQNAADAYNRAKNDPDHYYLPESWDGKTFDWKREKDHSGELFAALLMGCGMLLFILQGREEERKRVRRAEILSDEYPTLIMKFTLLMQAGLSARSAFERIAADYEGQNSIACEEIRVLCREIESGVSETEAYRRLGERCGQIRYRTFATLLTQNLRKGTRYMTDVLEREAQEAWEERKRSARVQGEMTSTRLLFPMLLMLLVVMAVIMIPAFLTFYQA